MRRTASQLQRTQKDGGIGLLQAFDGGAQDKVNLIGKAKAAQEPWQAWAPVRNDPHLQTASSQFIQQLPTPGVHLEHGRIGKARKEACG